MYVWFSVSLVLLKENGLRCFGEITQGRSCENTFGILLRVGKFRCRQAFVPAIQCLAGKSLCL